MINALKDLEEDLNKALQVCDPEKLGYIEKLIIRKYFKILI